MSVSQFRGLHLATLALLLVTAARLYALSSDQWQLMRQTQDRNERILSYGSLSGIDSNGREKRADFKEIDRLALFVIRSAGDDVAFWNDVASRVSKHRVGLWAVCDNGPRCNGMQARARFPILGFMDPYQMRNLAAIDALGEIAIYDKANTLQVRVKRAASAAAMSELILQGAK